MVSSNNEVALRMPTKEEIDQITIDMVSKVYTRGMIHKTKGNKMSGVFIKRTDPNKIEINEPKDKININVKTVNKKWEAKKGDIAKGPEVQTNDNKKEKGS